MGSVVGEVVVVEVVLLLPSGFRVSTVVFSWVVMGLAVVTVVVFWTPPSGVFESVVSSVFCDGVGVGVTTVVVVVRVVVFVFLSSHEASRQGSISESNKYFIVGFGLCV